MALINKIRERTLLVVFVVGAGLFLFIITDLFFSNQGPFSGRDTTIGEIAGEEITLEDYQRAIEEMKYNWAVNTNRNPTEREMNSIRQQAWDKLVAEKAFTKEFDALGLKVTPEEVIDMVQGNNISPEIRQAFTNPETGEFNRDQVVSYLQNISQMPPQQQAAWQAFESNLAPARLRLKYDNLLIKSNYVTDAEAKRQYKAENTIAEAKYLYVPFYSVSDSAVEVSDQMLEDYLEAHKEEHQVEESRNITYVNFPVVPSAKDTATILEEIRKIKNNFASANNDSTFAALNTDGENAFGSYQINEIPQLLTDSIGAFEEGKVYGPFLEENGYKLYKVTGIIEDTASYARARHILFRTDENNKEEKRKEAQDILQQIKNGADFAEMAKQHSDDGSSAQGGDLGWFAEGRMVEPFEKAVFGRTDAGLVNNLVETEYGFHIIEVTEPKTNTIYKIASISREVYPSDNTRNQAFRKADYFAGNVSSSEEFAEQAAADSIPVISGVDLQPNATFIRGLDGNARSVIRWAFNEAEAGDVSEVFELENGYVIALLTKKSEKGTAELEGVREEIEAKVKAREKGKIIAEKLKDLSGTVDEIAAAYGQDASVYSTSELKISDNSLPGVGFDPKAVGKVFALKPGETSQPFIGENGVLVIETQAITEAPEIADYSAYKNQLQQQKIQRTGFEIAEAIREAAEIEDKRYKFY